MSLVREYLNVLGVILLVCYVAAGVLFVLDMVRAWIWRDEP